MKFNINKLKTLALAGGLLLGLGSCEKEDYDMLTAEALPDAEFAITSTIEPDFFLSKVNASDVATTLEWTTTTYNVASPVQYAIEGSVNEDFSTVDFTSAGTAGTSLDLTVGDMIKLAEAGGIDTDPETTDENGDPNNIGTLYFRVRSFLGEAYAVNNANKYTGVISTMVELEEGLGISISNWGLVGDAVNNWGATPDVPLYDDGSGVYYTYVYLKAGFMKFRENNEWTNNYGDSGADGTIDPGGTDIAIEEAGRYKVTLDFTSGTYSVEKYSLGVVGEAWNNWGADGPDAPMYYDYTTNTFKVSLKLKDGAMKIRLNSEWDVNYGDGGAGAIAPGGADFSVTAGFYTITLDLSQNTIVFQETDVLGLVGDATPDGWDAPDTYLTEIQPGVYFADGVTLGNGFMKYRFNESWDINYGGTDGELVQNGADIEITEGVYRVHASLVEGETATYSVE